MLLAAASDLRCRRTGAVLIVLFLAAACVLPVAEAAETETAKLANFEPYVGKWDFTDEFLEKNSWAKEFFAEVLEWGPRKNIVRLRETAHKVEANRVVFEGFAYWHPAEDNGRCGVSEVVARVNRWRGRAPACRRGRPWKIPWWHTAKVFARKRSACDPQSRKL